MPQRDYLRCNSRPVLEDDFCSTQWPHEYDPQQTFTNDIYIVYSEQTDSLLKDCSTRQPAAKEWPRQCSDISAVQMPEGNQLMKRGSPCTVACRGLMQHDCGVAQAEREEVRKAEKARKKEEARLAAEAEAKATAAAEAEAAAKAQADEDAKRKVQSLNRAFESGTPFTAFQCHVARHATGDSALTQSDGFDTRAPTSAAWLSLCWKHKQLRSLRRGVRPDACVADWRPEGR